jgi:signal transduction histidine kinase
MHYGLKEALYSFRTYLDSISKTKVNWLDLSDELKDFISKTCNEVTMKYNLHIEADKDYTIKSELARDIKLLVYEIVTNCIKHSNADAISMNCTIKNNQLNLIISDSGICDLAELEVFKGNGIRNMKKRVSRNNGRIMYYISNGSTGLTIEVFLPIA